MDKERYLITDKLGEGAYGVVYKAHDREENSLVAVKKIRCDLLDEGIPPSAIREISLLKQLSHHPHIVKLERVISQNKSLYLVFEFLEIDLHAHLQKPSSSSLPLPLIKQWTHQLLRAVEYIHSCGIMHRDLKPSNLLIDQHFNIKLGDFGLARSFSIPVRQYTHEVVTLWYRAPEVLLGAVYSTALDMWSIGCILAEMVTGVALLDGDCEIGQLFKTFQLLGTPTENNWPGVTNLPEFQPFFPKWPPQKLEEKFPSLCKEGLDLLQNLFIYSPSRRISARKALEHVWFGDLSDSSII